MEEGAKLQIVLVSGACCMPHLALLDNELDKNVRKAIEQAGAAAKITKVSLSAVLAGPAGLNAEQRGQVLALFQKYGARLAPAVLFGDQVRFAGSVPTTEQLRDALAKAAEA